MINSVSPEVTWLVPLTTIPILKLSRAPAQCHPISINSGMVKRVLLGKRNDISLIPIITQEVPRVFETLVPGIRNKDYLSIYLIISQCHITILKILICAYCEPNTMIEFRDTMVNMTNMGLPFTF